MPKSTVAEALFTWSGRRIRDAVRNGTLRVETVAEACLERVAERDDEVGAWSHVNRDLVMANARSLDRSAVKGSLHGIPIGIKDVILTRDMPTGYNSPAYSDFFPPVDAAPVATLRAAGALIFGKCDTVEFAAMGHLAKTRNPHDPSRTPGGSSSGSAAAVADGHVPITLGTQTGGSLIRPASFTGIAAFKPSWSAVSREGLKLYSASLDTLGWYSRGVDDLSLLADTFGLVDDPTLPDGSGGRLAYCKTAIWDEAGDEMKEGFLDSVDRLQRAGLRVEEIVLPRVFDDLVRMQDIIMRMEGQAAFLSEFAQFGGMLHPDFRHRLHDDMPYDKSDLRAAYDAAAEARKLFDAIAAPYVGILTPSSPGFAPVGLANTGSANFNRMWTLLHGPCVNVPIPRTAGGLPLGITVVGPRFSDRRTLAAAYAIEQIFADRDEALRQGAA